MARRLDTDKHADFEKHTGSKKHTEWRERFGRFSRCGLTVTRFCSVERVSVASFYRWRKHLEPAVRCRSRAVGRRRESGPQQLDKNRRESSPRRRRPEGSGAFRPVMLVSAPPAVVPAAPAVASSAVGAALAPPSAAPAVHSRVSAASALAVASPTGVPTSPGVSIHLPCGTRIDVPGEHLDALRTLVAELVRTNHDRESDTIHDLKREAASC